jgi:hypothetical protein
MLRIFRRMMLATILAASALTVPQVAQADDYWDGYWGWYDGSYQPYYSRRYYSPGYSYYGSPYGGYYGGGYYDRGYYGRGYGRRGNYYGTPNFGYRDYRGGGGSVNIGGLRFGWR